MHQTIGWLYYIYSFTQSLHKRLIDLVGPCGHHGGPDGAAMAGTQGSPGKTEPHLQF